MGTAIPGMSMDQNEYKYRAFISYSHRDKTWGDWLHKTLETYRTPARLAGRPSRDGAVPKRLYPIFRDRDELPSSASLGDNIDAALRDSRYLVVICSPTAAVSRWVDGEIRAFKKSGREDRVLCLIVDGEPNASDRPESGELECFPPALRFRVDAAGQLTAERTEPIAADARSGKDGKANARLKILAGLLGVGYDELRQREKQRRFWRRVQTAAASLALLAVLAGSWYWEAQQKTRQARVAQYTEAGRQLYVDGKPLQAAVFLSEAYRLGGRSPALRFLLARSMHYVEALDATVPEPGLFLTADVSRDGARFITAGGGGSVDVWDGHDGRALLKLKGGEALEIWGAFSPDGKYVAGAGKTSATAFKVNVHLWDAHSGALLYSLPFQDALIVRAVFDHDGGRLLTRNAGRGRGQTQVWDTASGHLLYSLPDKPEITHAGFSPDGKRVITSLDDDSIKLWDAGDGRLLRTLRAHTGAITNFAFSDDSRRLVSTSEDKSARVWDVASGKLLLTIARKNVDDYDGGHQDEVTGGAFLPGGKRLVTASKDKFVLLWDAADGKQLAELGRMSEAVAGVSVSQDGRHALAAAQDNSIWVWDLDPMHMSAALRGSNALFVPDGHRLLTLDSKEGVARLWGLDRLAANLGLAGKTPAFSADGARLATIDADSVRVWDRNGKALWAAEMALDPNHGYKTYPQDLQFSPDGTRLLVQSAAGFETAGLWDAASGKQIALLKGHSDAIETAAFIPDGTRIYTCAKDKTARLWDGKTGVPIASFPMADGCVDYPRFDPSGTRMAGTVEETPNRTEVFYHAELWDLAAGRRIAALGGYLHDYHNDVTFSPDGRELLTAGEDGKVRIWNAASGALLRTWDSHGSAPEALLFSPDGLSLATAHEDGTLRVWDADGGRLRWLSKTEQFGLSEISYSPDGTFLLLRGLGTGARILDSADGALLAELPGEPGVTETARYGPRGNVIATESTDADVTRLWDVHLEQREPAEVLALVHCKVHWQLQADQLVPAATDPRACAGGRR